MLLVVGNNYGTFQFFDVNSHAVLRTLKEHHGAGAIFTNNLDLYVSGSYDGTVKLWDSHNLAYDACGLTIKHDASMENVLMYPMGSLITDAGSPQVGIYNVVSGRYGNRKHLLAGLLDHHVKVYDLDSYTMQHSIKYPP
ncbi:snoRNA-binding rRNA-processing protein, partial [Massospora cicadina]